MALHTWLRLVALHVPDVYLFVIITLFRHEAERLEQEAKGRLERQKITDEAEAERSRKELLELQAQSAAVESTGQAKAEAQSRAEAARIQGEAAVQQAKLKAEATKIEAVSILASVVSPSPPFFSNLFPLPSPSPKRPATQAISISKPQLKVLRKTRKYL